MKKKIIISIEIILLVLLAILIFSECKKTYFFMRNHYRTLKNTDFEYYFTFPFVKKSMTNDTFFTIAIGRNILKNGITNYDNLTIHGKLKFPHSGVFDILIATIYNLFGFNRNLYLYCIDGTFYFYKFNYNIL